MLTTEEKIIARFRVKVTKKQTDDRTSLCGEKVQTAGGKQFFDIPAHQADYIKSIFPQYEVSEPYIPGLPEAAAATPGGEPGKP